VMYHPSHLLKAMVQQPPHALKPAQSQDARRVIHEERSEEYSISG
jgi:hypothetical protein